MLKVCCDRISDSSTSKFATWRVFDGSGDKFIVVKAKRMAKIPIETKSSMNVYPFILVRTDIANETINRSNNRNHHASNQNSDNYKHYRFKHCRQSF